MFTVPTQDGKSVPVSEIKDPYTVRLLVLQVELEILDPQTHKAKGRITTNPEPVFETDFFPDLVSFLKRQGITLADPTPVEVAPIS